MNRFNPPLTLTDRHEEQAPEERPIRGKWPDSNTFEAKGRNIMKKLGFATIVASGLAAAVLGFAGPAQADIDHHAFLNEITQTVNVPHVDTTVHQSR